MADGISFGIVCNCGFDFLRGGTLNDNKLRSIKVKFLFLREYHTRKGGVLHSELLR